MEHSADWTFALKGYLKYSANIQAMPVLVAIRGMLILSFVVFVTTKVSGSNYFRVLVVFIQTKETLRPLFVFVFEQEVVEHRSVDPNFAYLVSLQVFAYSHCVDTIVQEDDNDQKQMTRLYEVESSVKHFISES